MKKLHTNKEIAAAIQEALNKGWIFKKSNASAHVFGTLFCPAHNRSGCIVRIHSTPRNSENHAKKIRTEINKCIHQDLNHEDL